MQMNIHPPLTPFKVDLNPMFTGSSPLIPGDPFPVIAPADQIRVKAWIQRDSEYESALRGAQAQQARAFDTASRETRAKQDWLGPLGDLPGFRLIQESARVTARSKGKRGAHRPEIRLAKAELKRIAQQSEVLIPIRLDVEHEAYKLRDTFTWNLRETVITPEIFSTYICEDLRLPRQSFQKEIVSQVKQQIKDALATIDYTGYLADDLSTIREENRLWFERYSKRRKTANRSSASTAASTSSRTLDDVEYAEAQRALNDGMDVDEDEGENIDEFEKAVLASGLPIADEPSQELRISISLDITLDSVQLLDKFEWDISDPRNSPEEFAAVFAADLGLNGEFKTAVAHSIREQIDSFVKSLHLLEHIAGLPINDEDLKREFLPSLCDTVRVEAGDFTPSLNRLNADEVDRNDKEREREVRRKRRQTKGRGITLPDREPVKTHRTLVPKPSTVPLVHTIDQHGNINYPLPEMSYPYPIIFDAMPEHVEESEPVPPSPVKVYAFNRSRFGSAAPSGSNSRVGSGASRLKQLQNEEEFNLDLSTEGESAGDDRDDRNESLGGSTRARTPGSGNAKSSRLSEPGVQKTLEEMGVHPNIIDGEWHCANCGLPEIYCIGRRKGLSGPGTLCGSCGKYFNRYRKNEVVVYSHDPSVHRKAGASVKDPSEALVLQLAASKAAFRAAATAALLNPSPSVIAAPVNTRIEGGPSSAPSGRKRAGSVRRQRASSDPPQQEEGEEGEEEEEEEEEDSDDGSSAASAIPRGRRSPDPPYGSASPDSIASTLRSPTPPPAPAPVPTPARPIQIPRRVGVLSNQGQAPVPTWMEDAANLLRTTQIDDRFEIIARGESWRIRCLDCPGKLYNLGPGETLENFSVHFKNRKHRSNVEERVSKN